MKKTITAILAIVLMAIPAISAAHVESWAEYDRRLEKQIAELQGQLPMREKDDHAQFDMQITRVEKRDKTIISTVETKGKHGWIEIVEQMGGVERFKALQQRHWARQAMEVNGIELARRYTLRCIFVDNGKEICIVDVNQLQGARNLKAGIGRIGVRSAWVPAWADSIYGGGVTNLI